MRSPFGRFAGAARGIGRCRARRCGGGGGGGGSPSEPEPRRRSRRRPRAAPRSSTRRPARGADRARPRGLAGAAQQLPSDQYYAANLTVDGEAVAGRGPLRAAPGRAAGRSPGSRSTSTSTCPGQEFHGYKSLVLDNVTQDPSMLRERLAYGVFEAMGIAAPQIAFCRLTVNAEFWGLYTARRAGQQAVPEERASARRAARSSTTSTDDYASRSRGDGISAYSPVPFQPQTNENKLDSGLPDFVEAINETPQSRLRRGHGAVHRRERVPHLRGGRERLAEYDGFVAPVRPEQLLPLPVRRQKKFVFIPWDKDKHVPQRRLAALPQPREERPRRAA